MDLKKFLASSFIFSSFTEEEISRLAGFSSIKTLADGETLFSKGEKAEAFFIIVDGRLKIFNLSSEGSEQIIHIHRQHDLVAEAAIFDQITYPADCAPIGEATVVRIDGKSFIDMVTKNRQLTLKLLRSYSKRLRQFVSMVEDLSLKDIKGRLANHLLKNARPIGKKLVYEMTLSKKELASLLGTVPETLSRSLRVLKEMSLIEERDQEIEIIDPEGLKDLVV